MKTLYFDEMPRDVALLKDQRSDAVYIAGSMVYLAGVFKALLRYSTYDLLVFPARPWQQGDLRNSDLIAENSKRIRFIDENELRTLRVSEKLIVASGGPDLMTLNRKRRIIGRAKTPVTGLIHSINYAACYLPAMIGVFFSPLQRFDALICSSSAGQRAITNLKRVMQSQFEETGLKAYQPPWKSPVIPLGIDAESFLNKNGEQLRARLNVGTGPVLLYFGRFSTASKADLYPLLITFAKLSQKYPDAVLILAGDDTQCRQGPDLQTFASELGCAEKVRVFANPTTAEKHQLFALSDLFVFLSDSLQETFGIAIVEAMAAGLPVVASDWDGSKDLVKPSETGYLIPTYMPDCPREFDDFRGIGAINVPDLLASSTVVDLGVLEAALGRLIGDPDERRKMGAAAQKRALSYYDWSVVIKQYEDLWAALAEEAANSTTDSELHGIDPGNWGYAEVFGHYASGLIASNARIRISSLGRRCHGIPSLLARAAQPSSWFSSAEFNKILEILISREEMSLDELLAGKSAREDYAKGLSHICRLAKYGLITVTPFRDGATRPSESMRSMSEVVSSGERFQAPSINNN